MNSPFFDDFKHRFEELKKITEECEHCMNYKTYTRPDGSTGFRCEHCYCEFTPRD